MKKMLKYYTIAWCVMLALFNVLSFLSNDPTVTDKYTTSFWIGYGFITLTFIGQLVCAIFAMKGDDIKRAFYNVSLIKVSFSGLIASFVFGGICMIISSIEYWLGIVICSVILAINVLAVIKASAAVDAVATIDKSIKTKTEFIRSLTVDAETLISYAQSDTAKAECKKVYETVRYSDPMSNEALSTIEHDISSKFQEFASAVKANDSKTIAELANTLTILLGERNKKCKLLK